MDEITKYLLTQGGATYSIYGSRLYNPNVDVVTDMLSLLSILDILEGDVVKVGDDKRYRFIRDHHGNLLDLLKKYFHYNLLG